MSNLGLFILRVVPGLFMLLSHGWKKLIGFNEMASSFPDPLGVGSTVSLALTVFAEVVCPALIILGIATRLANIPVLITMLVAAFIIHANDPWMKQEFPLLFAVIALTLVFTGGGSWSMGRMFKSKWLH